MPDELMPIGEFARRSGLTASALRFYADTGVLLPAEVDSVTGYRYYAAEQVERAGVLRRLREIGMPLAPVLRVLDGDAAEAVRLVREHAAAVAADAVLAERTAAELEAAFGTGPEVSIGAVRGSVLAAAIEQVLAATGVDPALPVLDGVFVEALPDAVVLTATDRYRLSTRTMAPAEAPASSWAGTIAGADLRAAVPEIRRTPVVALRATAHRLRLGAQSCRIRSEDFPDYRGMLAALSAVETRVTVGREAVLRALEEHGGGDIELRAAAGATAPPAVHAPADATPCAGGELALGGTTSSGELRVGGAALPATVTGSPCTLHFDPAILHPAVATAIGPDLLLDLRGPARPITLRSADRGDLTTLAMPIHPRNGTP
ncbi:DNA polymerase III subunit beta family protein [Nocardia jiangsuensis]|uniref:MerR family transcriptional regulator n=1 Tax=Nocardia jiangsuensis TaxID=1691563 RepID=A0ABV8DWH3_9NOCA